MKRRFSTDNFPTDCKTMPRTNVSPEYYSWQAMLSRCTRPTDRRYPDYGGRGISVCDRWRFGDGVRSGFICFVLDMGMRPDGMTLDRYPNNNGNYEPGNCRWATPVQQSSRTRRRKTSRFLGVCWHKQDKKWKARIFNSGRLITIGGYKSQILAALAFDDAAFELRGRDAVLNFPERKR